MIQAVGQKIIVYASVISIFIQALGARKLARARGGGSSLDGKETAARRAVDG